MAAKNPLGKMIGAALHTAKGTVKDPVGTATKAVTGAVSEGLELTRALVPGRRGSKSKARAAAPATPSTPAGPGPRPVADPAAKTGPVAVPAEKSRKDQGDPLTEKQAPEAKQAPAPKSPAKKAPAKKTSAKKAPATKTSAKKAPSKKAAVTAPARAAAKKSPAKKSPAKKASASKAAKPATAAEVLAGGPDVETPVGTTGADVATNPSTAETDLQQPGTEPLVDPGTAKAVASEAATLQKAADPDKTAD